MHIRQAVAGKTSRNMIVILSIIVAIVALSFFVPYYLYPKVGRGLDKDLEEIRLNAFLTLVLTVTVLGYIAFFRNGVKNCKNSYESAIDYIKGNNIHSTVINLLLVGITFIAIWLTIRAMAHLFLVFVTSGSYSEYQILGLLTYVLTVTLCFSIIRIHNDDSYRTKKFLEVGVQASLIALLIFIYEYSSSDFLSTLQNNLSGVLGALIIGITLVVMLLSLVFMIRRLELQSRASDGKT